MITIDGLRKMSDRCSNTACNNNDVASINSWGHRADLFSCTAEICERLDGLAGDLDRIADLMFDPKNPQHYRCEMCQRVFVKGQSEEDARAEAEGKGIDPDKSGLVCDGCYKKTPWGKAENKP